MKIITLLAVLMLILVSCTSEPTAPILPNEPANNNADTESQTASVAQPVVETTPEADIIIVGGKLDPEDLTIPNKQDTVLTIHNTDDVAYRFDIPIYGAEVSEEIGAGEYTTVTLSPKNVGYVSMELNVVAMGTIKVE